MQSKLQGFFGYSSNPASAGDAIEKAVKELNNSNEFNIITWRTLSRGGSLVINDILLSIERSDFTCFDLTGMNENVLFEIGFAIAKRKPIWLVFDTSFEESYRKWEQLGLFAGITYVSYTNHNNIIDKFNSERPFEGKEIFTRLLEDYIEQDQTPNVLLYLKQQIDTTASNTIDITIKNRQVPVIIDDPTESKVQNLSWYIQNINSSVSVLTELSSQYRSGSTLQNMKCSFVAGLAKGLNKRVLMTAEQPYKSPSDYKNLVKTYDSIDNTQRAIGNFLNDAKTDAIKIFASPKNKAQLRRKKSNLQSISFGEWIAEHEKNKISDYYVETKHIKSLLKNEHNIIVGRKGCGKTASFYYLNDIFASDVRNVVCVIKPNSFDIDALLSLLRLAQEDYQKYYLIETSWKFLIYTEIARSFYERISIRPIHSLTPLENNFLSYVNNNKSIILSDFSTRLELKLIELKNNFSNILNESQENFKSKISEHLHNTILYEVRSFIADLSPKSGRIVVLIDNLDKSWKVNNDLGIISQWVLGLLSVSGRLASEISFIKKKNTNVEFSLTIFLRTDILKRVIQAAREPDKIEKTELKYDDKEILFRILNERFIILNEDHDSAHELWEKYITPYVFGKSTQDYIFDIVYPRPRDLLLFIRNAKDTAVARGHEIIEESDLTKAHELYSDWVLSSLFVENGITQEQMEGFVYNLAGNTQVIEEKDVITAMELAEINIETREAINYFIDHLVALSILGRETIENNFSFEYDLTVDKRNKIMASRLPLRRYKIHNALVPALHLIKV